MAVLLKWTMALAISTGLATAAQAATLDAARLPKVRAATFEVVAAKADESKVVYDKPLPVDQLSYQERTDHYRSLGTAFAIGDGRFVTAFHVFLEGIDSLQGPLMLRDEQGHVFAIDKVLRFSPQEDFVEFSLAKAPAIVPLEAERSPAVNETVFAVGNALGTGVVLRDGLYTSDTPEELDGRWKWMRFSAPASPGNSGGPLIDDQGKVIGVVLRKSANENLNYALPISRVLDASDHEASIDLPQHFSVAFARDTRSNRLRDTVALPLGYAAFNQRLSTLFNKASADETRAWQHDHAATLFPLGNASHDLLAKGPWTQSLPAVTREGDDGTWIRTDLRHDRSPTANKGYIEQAGIADTVLWHIHSEADQPGLGQGGRPVIEQLLSRGNITRSVGQEKVRITSLGEAIASEPFTDRLGRSWHVDTFAVPFIDGCIVIATTPTPEGAVGMLRFGRARERMQITDQLRLMADMEDIAYHGTLAQWKAFTSAGALPTALRDTSIGSDGKVATLATDGLQARWPATLVPLNPRTQVTVASSWTVENGNAAIHARRLGLLEEDAPNATVYIDRLERAAEDSPQEALSRWADLMKHAHPHDGQPYNHDDWRIVSEVYDPAHPDAAQHAYVISYAQKAQPSDEDMRARLHEARSATRLPDAP
ncbi:trypsin-like peptidase domain-containing protein [Bacillus sp. NP157]|nr:trypsin-like peptidase domain-containing protein [Bacillus sp. NP157]